MTGCIPLPPHRMCSGAVSGSLLPDIQPLYAIIRCMPQSTARTTEIVIRNDMPELVNLRDSLERIGAELGVPSQALTQLQVALDEIASNVIKYVADEFEATELSSATARHNPYSAGVSARRSDRARSAHFWSVARSLITFRLRRFCPSPRPCPRCCGEKDSRLPPSRRTVVPGVMSLFPTAQYRALSRRSATARQVWRVGASDAAPVQHKPHRKASARNGRPNTEWSSTRSGRCPGRR
jgi:hypothetical protein